MISYKNLFVGIARILKSDRVVSTSRFCFANVLHIRSYGQGYFCIILVLVPMVDEAHGFSYLILVFCGVNRTGVRRFRITKVSIERGVSPTLRKFLSWTLDVGC